MKKAPKVIVIVDAVLAAIFSCYFIPSFFIAEWRDVLDDFYDGAKIAYCVFLALSFAYFVFFLYLYEVGRMEINDTENLLASRREARRNAVKEKELAPVSVMEKIEATSDEPSVLQQEIPVEPLKKRSEPVEEEVIAEPVQEEIMPEPVQEEIKVETIIEEPAPIKEKTPAKKTVIFAPEAKKKREYFSFVFLNRTYEISAGWEKLFAEETRKGYFRDIVALLDREMKKKTIYPAPEDIFRAFEYTDPEDVKVIIIGKLPWYRKDQADGLAYSSKKGSDINATTEIVLNEAVRDVRLRYDDGSLIPWAKNGVFLLNMSLTAPNDKPSAHMKKWLPFTEAALRFVAETKKKKIALLWGGFAAQYEELLASRQCVIIKSASPSPLSAHGGFTGSEPFSQVNRILNAAGEETVDWSLNND